jgi:hypothetical protein
MCGQTTSVLVLCDTPVCSDFHKSLGGTAFKRQVVLNHLEKFAVLKFMFCRNKQSAAFDDGCNAFPLEIGDPLGIFNRNTHSRWLRMRLTAGARHWLARAFRLISHLGCAYAAERLGCASERVRPRLEMPSRIERAASRALVRLSMSERLPSGILMRHMPG